VTALAYDLAIVAAGMGGIVLAWWFVQIGALLGAAVAFIAIAGLYQQQVADPWLVSGMDLTLGQLVQLLAYAGVVIGASIVGHRRRRRAAETAATAYVVRRP
jgi:hypothetical protein